MEKVYTGYRNGVVHVDGVALRPRSHICNHSPTGFSWGYCGSGPAQLALAIMCEEFGEDLDTHPVSYQDFKEAFISKFKQNKPFRFNSSDVRLACRYIGAKKLSLGA